MFDLDKWQEIFISISKNPLRSALTCISVGLGIFLLIILLGASKGLQNGAESQFKDDAINSIWINAGQTSLPHRGLQPGRYIQFTNQDYEEIRQNIPGVEHISGRFYIRGEVTINYGKEYGDFDVRCVHPGHQHVEKTIMVEGRYINPFDIDQKRKVAVIGKLVKEALFKDGHAIGKYINVNSIPFKVVGVFIDAGAEGEQEQVYLPITTAQQAFAGGNRINRMMLTTGDATLEEGNIMAEKIRRQLSNRHNFSMEDPRAVRVNNSMIYFQRFQNLTS
ncbi:MAG: ABC transporter permease, partial [Bacteroidota bacterium]